MADSRYELRVRPAIARSLLDVIRTRFDHVPAPGAERTVLIVENLDQAAVRALLTLLWDAGHEVLSLAAEPDHDAIEDR
jgi:hypothetical protein